MLYSVTFVLENSYLKENLHGTYKMTWKISFENILDVIFHAFVLENGYSKKTYKKKLNMIFIMLYFYNFCFEKFF